MFRSADERVIVNIYTLPWYKWPLWFSNDIMDSQEAAPISDELKTESFGLREYIEANTTWDETRDEYQWKHSENRREFNKLFDAFVEKLESELGDGYKVVSQYSTKNKHNYVRLSTKRSGPLSLIRKYIASK